MLAQQKLKAGIKDSKNGNSGVLTLSSDKPKSSEQFRVSHRNNLRDIRWQLGDVTFSKHSLQSSPAESLQRGV